MEAGVVIFTKDIDLWINIWILGLDSAACLWSSLDM